MYCACVHREEVTLIGMGVKLCKREGTYFARFFAPKWHRNVSCHVVVPSPISNNSPLASKPPTARTLPFASCTFNKRPKTPLVNGSYLICFIAMPLIAFVHNRSKQVSTFTSFHSHESARTQLAFNFVCLRDRVELKESRIKTICINVLRNE